MCGLKFSSEHLNFRFNTIIRSLDVHLLPDHTAYIFFRKEPLSARACVIRICFLNRAVLFAYARDRCGRRVVKVFASGCGLHTIYKTLTERKRWPWDSMGSGYFL